MSVKNRVVIITGAGSGIGEATAIVFAKEGAHVVMVDRNEERLKTAVQICEDIKGKKPLMIVADLSLDDDVNRIVSSTINAFGRIDVLVNNAGIHIQEENVGYDYSMQVLDQVMGINFRASVNLTNVAAKHLVESKGNIVNICSIAAVLPHVSLSAYCASKAAFHHFSRCIALELAPKRVRVNIVNPGPVRTNIIENFENPDKLFRSFAALCPLSKISEPEEVADLILFLASEKARSITGSAHFIDNGLNLKGVP